MIGFFENVDGILVSKNETIFNAEEDVAIIKGVSSFELKQKIGCDALYNVTENYKVLFNDFNHELFLFINAMGGIITSIDEDFDRIIKSEKLEKALGLTRVKMLKFIVKKTTNGINCNPCEC